MKTKQKIHILALISLFIFGCSSKESENRKQERPESAISMSKAKADSTGYNGVGDKVSEHEVSSSAARVSKDTSRKFIRTAELKFKVRDLRMATYHIEDIAARFEGFVTYTNLSSTIDHRILVPVSRDSSLESVYYTVGNDMIIRVPDKKLDTTLKSMAGLMDYLDFRIIRAEDVSLTLLSDRLEENRLKVHEDRLKNAIEARGRKLTETSDAEEKLLNRQTQGDNARVNRLQMLDQVSFSTIKINIYQHEAVKRDMVENEQTVEPYEPGFGSRLKESLRSGWEVLETGFLFLLRIWWFWILGVVIFLVIKNYRRKEG